MWPLLCAVVAGFQHHVDGEAQRIQQIHEGLEQVLAGDGGHQHGHAGVVLLVAVVVVPIALARHDLQVVGGADGVGEREVAVAGHPQMRLQFLFAELLEAAGAGGHLAFAEHVAEKSLQKTHRCSQSRGSRQGGCGDGQAVAGALLSNRRLRQTAKKLPAADRFRQSRPGPDKAGTTRTPFLSRTVTVI